jgi:hypothetical protein
MSAWAAQWPALAAAIAVLFVPGLLLGVILRLRGLLLWASAPAASAAMLTTASLVLGRWGVGWRPLPALGAVAAIGAVALVIAALVGRRRWRRVAPRSGQGARRLLFAGVVIGVLLTAARVGLYIGAPGAISQTNDASFHLNALRFAVDTGAASPLQLTSMLGAQTFYPSAWHVLASLVVQLTGAGVEVAANATSIVIAAVVWPLGIAALGRVVGGPLAGATAAAAAAAIPAFPLLMLQWGVLYPQLLAVALLPAAIAVLARPGGLGTGGRAGWGRPATLVVVALIAIGFSQPSVLLAWAVAALAIGGGAIAARWRGLSSRRRALAALGLAVALCATLAAWYLFGQSIEGTWPPTTGVRTAAVEVLANGFLGYPWALGASLLMLIGIVAALRRPSTRWLALTWLALAGLYVVAAAVAVPALRAFLVDPWYDDPYRLAALMPVVVLPLAGLGVSAVAGWAGRAIRLRAAGAWLAVGVVGLVGVVSLAVAPEIDRRDVFAHRIDANLYRSTATSFLSDDERALLERLADSVPADAVVVANPSTGAAFGYALSGRNVIPRTWSPPPSEAYSVLWTSLRDVAADGAVCPALDAFGARYVLDFGPGEVYPGRWVMPGFDDLDGQPGFQLIDRQGAATLWRITACG